MEIEKFSKFYGANLENGKFTGLKLCTNFIMITFSPLLGRTAVDQTLHTVVAESLVAAENLVAAAETLVAAEAVAVVWITALSVDRLLFAVAVSLSPTSVPACF